MDPLPTNGGALATRADVEFAELQLNRGASPAEVQAQLMGRGLDKEIAATLVQRLVSRSQPAAGRGMVLRFVGSLVFVVGIALFVGNITRLFPTVPLAGFLTMGIGGAIYRMGQKEG